MKKNILLLVLSLFVLNTFSQSTINSLIIEKLDKYTFYGETELEQNKKYELHEFLLNENKKVFLSYTSTENYSCRACGVKLSVFVLKKSNDNWEITEEYLGNIEIGSLGDGPKKENIKIYDLQNSFVLSIKGHFLGQGILEEYISLYKPVEGTIKSLGNVTTKYDDSGSLFAEEGKTNKWEGQYFFLEKPDSYPEILLNINGEKDGVAYSKTVQYIYNGEMYIEK